MEIEKMDENIGTLICFTLKMPGFFVLIILNLTIEFKQ